MRLLGDHELGSVRVRVTDCGCGPRCDTRFVFATTHRELWLSVGVCDVDTVGAHVGWLLEDEPADGVRPSEMLDRGVALMGLRWQALTHSDGAAVRQLLAYDSVPAWMLRLPLETMWGVRGCVFGDELTRVPRALVALRDAYEPDAPATAAVRQMRRPR